MSNWIFVNFAMNLKTILFPETDFHFNFRPLGSWFGLVPNDWLGLNSVINHINDRFSPQKSASSRFQLAYLLKLVIWCHLKTSILSKKPSIEPSLICIIISCLLQPNELKKCLNPQLFARQQIFVSLFLPIDLTIRAQKKIAKLSILIYKKPILINDYVLWTF